MLKVARFLKETPEFDFAFLNAITAIDYVEYFELVYHLLCMKQNRSLILKTQCYGRVEPSVPSLVELWKGADLQEREIWDLMGIRFDGHPNMKRMIWSEVSLQCHALSVLTITLMRLVRPWKEEATRHAIL